MKRLEALLIRSKEDIFNLFQSVYETIHSKKESMVEEKFSDWLDEHVLSRIETIEKSTKEFDFYSQGLLSYEKTIRYRIVMKDTLTITVTNHSIYGYLLNLEDVDIDGELRDLTLFINLEFLSNPDVTYTPTIKRINEGLSIIEQVYEGIQSNEKEANSH